VLQRPFQAGVLGETAEGALRIARYHFYRSDQIQLAEAGAVTAT
jgi:hypothetical protein